MKILSIAGRNLNSLRMDFKVDFTSGSLKDCGIFAITGPTGAGKTTLLDAITLALYGKTPRLASDEDIISYGAGEAEAVVVFQTSEGMFKSEWKVRRARNRHDGAIQQSSMQVSSLPDGKILTQKKQEALDKVKELIKLEYKQFLKSVLLAQGEFKAFLDAREGERGEMLEKISDTSLYTRLSKRAFDRRRKEEQALEMLKATIGNVVLLSDDERKDHEDNIKELKATEFQQQKEFADLQIKLNWLQLINGLVQKKQVAENEVMLCRQALETEQTSLQRWEAHLMVAGFEPEWFQYLSKSEDESLQKINLEKLKDSMNLLAQKSQSAETAVTSAQVRSGEAMKLREEKMPGLLEALTRQGDMLSIKKEVEGIQEKCKVKIAEQSTCNTKILSSEKLLTNHKKRLEELGIWIRQHQYYAVAGDGFTRASLLVSQLIRSRDDIKLHESELSQVIQKIAQANLELIKSVDNAKNAEEELKLNQDLEHKTRLLLRGLRSHLKTQIKESGHFHESIHLQIEDQQNSLSRQEFLAENLAKLHEGEACPLCGSTEHPNQTLSITDLNKEIDGIKGSLKENQATLKTNIQHQRTLEKLYGNLDEFQELSEEEIDPQHQNAEAIYNEQIPVWKALPKNANEASLKLASAKQKQQSLRESITQFEAMKTQATGKLQHATDNMDKEVNGLREIATQYQLSTDLPELPNLPKLLKEYSDEYHTKTNEDSILKVTIPGIKTSIETLNEQVAGLTKDISNLQSEIENKHIIILQYNDDIIKAYSGYSSLEDAREKLLTNEKFTNEAAKHAADRLNIIRQEFGKIQGEFKNAEIALGDLMLSIKNLKLNLESGLGELGLEADTAIIREKLLIGNERIILEKLYKTLHEKVVVSLANFDTVKNQLEQQQSLEITKEEIITIEGKIKEVREDIVRLNQELGREGQVLKVDDEKQYRLKEYKKKINIQESIFQKWAALSALIGSDSGKKFNQFAQGLTLDRLLLVSNHHLQLLNDRYLLKRNTSDQGLRLLIIDQYQADNEREINTLSGGESFLVSLALALGLSEMTSKLTTIDSLFIDEGFGSLDADTLEVALNALRGLQISGKTIGIISHVERLKDEIYTQVEITKGADGFSTLKIIP